MNKGFSLIEVIVYTSLLSLLTVGIFSSVMLFTQYESKKPTFSEADYQLLIKNLYE